MKNLLRMIAFCLTILLLAPEANRTANAFSAGKYAAAADQAEVSWMFYSGAPSVSYICTNDGIAFQAEDFTRLAENGNVVSSVAFEVSAIAEGNLYYGRTSTDEGIRITADAPRYYVAVPSGISNVLLLEKLTFVPANGYMGTVSIPFTAYFEGSNNTMSGDVNIEVIKEPSSGTTITIMPEPSTPPSGTVTVPAGDALSENPSTNSSAFRDIVYGVTDDWLYTAVMDLASAGIIGGYEDGTFRPNEEVTYGQALALIMRAVGYNIQQGSGEYWAMPYLSQAAMDGILPDNSYSIIAPIDRNIIAEITAKALALPLTEHAQSPFADIPVSHPAAPYVLALYDIGIINGSISASGERSFYGDSNIQRGEIAAIVWRIYNFRSSQGTEDSQLVDLLTEYIWDISWQISEHLIFFPNMRGIQLSGETGSMGPVELILQPKLEFSYSVENNTLTIVKDGYAQQKWTFDESEECFSRTVEEYGYTADQYMARVSPQSFFKGLAAIPVKEAISNSYWDDLLNLVLLYKKNFSEGNDAFTLQKEQDQWQEMLDQEIHSKGIDLTIRPGMDWKNYYVRIRILELLGIPNDDPIPPVYQPFLTEEEATQIALNFWKITPGDTNSMTEYKMYVSLQDTVEKQGKTYYYFMLYWMVTDGYAHPSTIDILYVDAQTGSCLHEVP